MQNWAKGWIQKKFQWNVIQKDNGKVVTIKNWSDQSSILIT